METDRRERTTAFGSCCPDLKCPKCRREWPFGLGVQRWLDKAFLIQVDLPENSFTVVFDRAKVPLAVAIVVWRESIESLHLLADRGLIGQRQGVDTGWLKKPTGYPHCCPAQVI